jgi:hypothetical protein
MLQNIIFVYTVSNQFIQVDREIFIPLLDFSYTVTLL